MRAPIVEPRLPRVLTLLPWLGLSLPGCALVGIGDLGDEEPARDGASDAAGTAPVVRSVAISPASPFSDGEAECRARYDDDDSERLDVAYTWRNVTRGTKLGTRETVELSPAEIAPGEVLRCDVVVADPEGRTASGASSAEPRCGFADTSSLRDVDVSIHIIFRPFKTDDLVPGYEGEPWDWDGTIPDWISDLVAALSDLADVVSSLYPDPTVVSAAEALAYAEQIIELMEEYGPGLFAATVPPDPNLYPYMFDSEGQLHGYSDVGDGFDWDDSYEVDITLRGQDFRDRGLAIDMEDYDTVFDDNMGDYLDQGSIPLALAPQVFLDGAYCSSLFYNPGSRTRESDVSIVPSSILWMEIEVW